MKLVHSKIIQMYNNLCERAEKYNLKIGVTTSHLNIFSSAGQPLTTVKTVQEGHIYLNGFEDGRLKG